jgi:AcrR family transcriptional regulator
MATDQLPLAGHPATERADAARNRRAALAAASALMAERGPEGVTMDQVAAAAGVGKGTLYRRFGDRHGLLLALLDDAERDLQEAILRGPSPLGPGAPADERLIAFLHALVDLLEQRGEVIRASETSSPGARVRGGAYGAWHRHLEVLLGELHADPDVGTLAHVLLAPLSAEQWTSLRAAGVDRADLAGAVERAWRAVAVR